MLVQRIQNASDARERIIFELSGLEVLVSRARLKAS